MPQSIRRYVLARRPEGMPRAQDFEMVETEYTGVEESQILVRNEWFSVDASMRLRMDVSDSPYLTPYQPGDSLDGWAIGVVVESRAPGFDVGSWVFHYQGWRDYALLNAGKVGWVEPRVVRVDDDRSPERYLGVLGPSGLTSWAGLEHVARLAPGDVVYVSAAAGAVGSLAVQIAKLRGNHVIGSAGSDEKVAYIVDELGADAAFNYRIETVQSALHRLAPDGIDVYFDNVGEGHLDGALLAMRPGGRIALCGSIASYNATDEDRPGIRNLFKATERGLTLRGYLARMFADRWDEFYDYITPLVAEGLITYPESVAHGLEAAPGAFIDLMAGANIGKTLVHLADRE